MFGHGLAAVTKWGSDFFGAKCFLVAGFVGQNRIILQRMYNEAAFLLDTVLKAVSETRPADRMRKVLAPAACLVPWPPGGVP